ncbi:site-specific integrase [Phytoactinopolyspora halotolerans]|uniref:Site-specific integrase n=2 Tax=Phytoactinopolyspora halotolerans TaxID=1981512 RepID=A0A6L9S9Y9_9ACTN|nr:site-specific integrase [Phytoactinopolyspora halotolerans]
MMARQGRRRFGWVRKLPSGRFQASYLGDDGQRRYAPDTFEREGEASDWLTLRESEILRGEWIDPLLGQVKFSEYASRWIAEREVSERTREIYRSLFRLHLEPFLGQRALTEISTEVVRSWRAELRDAGRSEIRVAKSYRLLRAIMNTAVDDGRIKRNPCRIKSADKEYSPERPVASIPQVYALADNMPERFRLLILAAAFTGLRWGELIALRRSDVDLSAPSIRVPRKLAQLDSGQLVPGPTKSAAGFRTVALPPILVPEFERHLVTYVASSSEALLFTGEKGATLRRGNWHRSANWAAAVRKAGLPDGFRFHDLRHTGNHLAALSGATTRELMNRMGHASMRAALIYQHATNERDREIARRLSAAIGEQHTATSGPATGPDEAKASSTGQKARRANRTWIARTSQTPQRRSKPRSGPDLF